MRTLIVILFVMACGLGAGAMASVPVPEAPSESEASAHTPAPPVFRLKDELVSNGEAKSGGDVGTMVVGLAAVLGIILLLAWLSKRFNFTAPGGHNNMRLISAMSVGQKEKIVLVEVEGEKLLLGVTPHQINALKELGKTGQTEEEALASESQTNTPRTEFADRISKLLNAGVTGHD